MASKSSSITTRIGVSGKENARGRGVKGLIILLSIIHGHLCFDMVNRAVVAQPPRHLGVNTRLCVLTGWLVLNFSRQLTLNRN